VTEYKIYYRKEAFIQSVINDAFTFGIMFALFYLNHMFCGGKGIINIIIGFFILCEAVAVAKRQYKTIPEMKEELARLESAEAAKLENNSARVTLKR